MLCIRVGGRAKWGAVTKADAVPVLCLSERERGIQREKGGAGGGERERETDRERDRENDR